MGSTAAQMQVCALLLVGVPWMAPSPISVIPADSYLIKKEFLAFMVEVFWVARQVNMSSGPERCRD